MPSRDAMCPSPYDFLPPVPALTVTSDDLAEGGRMPLDHVYGGAGGENISPQLSWTAGPEGTASYAVTCFDPDAPSVSGYWHWILVGIGADVTSLARGAAADLPAGAVHLRNDFGDQTYDGAAPPPGHGLHRYIFAVSALDTADLGLDPMTPGGTIGFMITAHTIARGYLTVTWDR